MCQVIRIVRKINVPKMRIEFEQLRPIYIYTILHYSSFKYYKLYKIQNL